ncbi:MAG: hypothetical protein EAZ60_12320, partial [Oscillatoriales cyanobacterium]
FLDRLALSKPAPLLHFNKAQRYKLYIDRARVAQLQLPLRIYHLFLTEPRPIRQLWNLLFGRSSVFVKLVGAD